MTNSDGSVGDSLRALTDEVGPGVAGGVEIDSLDALWPSGGILEEGLGA